MDLARLGLQVDSSSVRSATGDLSRFGREGKEAAQSSGAVERSTSSMGTAFKGAAVQIAAAVGVMATVQKALGAADQYTNMQNRLLALGASHESAAAQIRQLGDIALATRAPLESTVELYSRLSLTSESLGASQSELMEFTESVGLALAASGTTAAQASGALTQLSQAMAGGVVRAEEFNSMIEGAPGLLIAVANGMEGVNGDLGKLRQMMLDGELTSEKFFSAMLSQNEALQESFGNTAPTIASAFTAINNEFTLFIGSADQATGVTSAIADAMLLMAENMEVLLPVVGAVAIAVAAMAAPFTLIAVAVGASAFAIITHWDKIKATFQAGIDFMAEMVTSAQLAMFDFSYAVATGVENAKAFIAAIPDAFKDALADAVKFISGFAVDLVAALKEMGRDALGAAKQIGADIVAGIKDGITQKWDDLKSYVSGLGTGMLDGMKSVLGIRSPSREFMEIGRYSVEGLEIGMDDNAHKAIDRAKQLGTEIGKGVRDGLEPVLGTIFDGIASGDIKGIGNNLLGMAQNSFSGLLKGAFGTGGGGFGEVLSGIKSSFAGIGSALGTGVGLIGKLGGALSAALPVIGLVSTAISFFKTKTTELDAGLRVAVTGLDAMVQTFRTVEKIKFMGLSKKVSTTGTAAEFEIANPIQLAVQNVGERVADLANVLGLAAGNIAKTTFDFEVSTKGKSDSEIQKAIEAELGRLGNTFADAVIGSYTEFLPDEAELARIEKAMEATFNIGGRGGESAGEARRAALEQQRIAAQTAIEITHLNESFAGLQREGEGSLDTLERVVASLYGVNEALYLFDRAALDMTVSGASAATKLVELAGGLEAFTSKTQFVFQNMLTATAQDARLAEIAMASLSATFGDLQFAIPETHAQFMALMDAQDLTTAAGRQTYAALMDVAGAFVQVNGTAQAAAEALRASRAQEVSDAQSVLQARATAADAALRDAETALRAAFAAERESITSAYADQVAAAQASADATKSMADASKQSAQDRLNLYRSLSDALERAYKDRRVLDAIGQRNQNDAATAFLRSAVAAGGTTDLDALEQALSVVADPSTGLYESFVDYQQDFNVNTNLIDQLRRLTNSQLSVEERTLRGVERTISAVTTGASAQVSAIQSARDAQLAALDGQMNALLGIDTSVMTVAQAIAALKGAQASAEAATEAATGVTIDAAGTQFTAGSFGANLDAIFREELGRGVRTGGLEYYGGQWEQGRSLADIAAEVASSPEAANFDLTGIPKFAGGGYTGDGSRSGGLDGQGGFMAMLHPQETVIDHTRQQKGDGGSGSAAMISELRELNQRTRYLQDKIKTLARLANDHNVNGQPGFREGAGVLTE